MDIQFSLWPLGDTDLKDEMEEVKDILDKAKVDYDMNAMSTTLKGEWDDAMKAIGDCHKVLRKRHKRVLCQIVIDDDAA